MSPLSLITQWIKIVQNLFLQAHGSKDLLKECQFKVLRKCRGKFDCLVYEMLLIKSLNPNLNI